MDWLGGGWTERLLLLPLLLTDLLLVVLPEEGAVFDFSSLPTR
jgi:hypothetical protein